MTPKSERFEMRLDQETIERLDDWRKEQGDMISRAEAARRLIEEGLEQYLKPRVLFSAGEKTLAMMLRDIYRHLKIKGDIDPEFLQSAITGGHTWGLKWQYPYIFNDRDDRSAAVTEVINILEMWAFISTGYKALSDSDKAILHNAITHFLDGKDFTIYVNAYTDRRNQRKSDCMRKQSGSWHPGNAPAHDAIRRQFRSL